MALTRPSFAWAGWIQVRRSPSFSSLETLAWTVGRGMFVLLAMSWRFLRPYFLIAMMIWTFWWYKKETNRLIFCNYSSGAIWLKYGPKRIGGSRNGSRLCQHWDRLWSWQTWNAHIGQD